MAHFPTLVPYIVVKDAEGAIRFYGQAFGAFERSVSKTPDGKVMNAQLEIGDGVLMLNDEFPDYGSNAPQPGDKLPFVIHITSKNIDADWKRAVDAGCEITMPLELQFWGDRYGQLKCPYGYSWSMSQNEREMSPEELQQAATAAFDEGS